MAAAKPPLEQLSDLVPGRRADFFALLTDRKRGVTREGRPYYHCRFRDAKRAVSLMAWADDRWFGPCEKEWREGQFYKLRAVYAEHERYGPQIELHELRPVRDSDRKEGFDEAAFVEASRHDLAYLWTELRTLATKHVEDEPLRALVIGLLDAHAEPLMRLPATRDRAYPFRGGLLEHVVAVTRLAVDLADRYALAFPDLKPPLNRSLVAAGAVLHDVGRVRELGDDLGATATLMGRFFGPGVLGRDLIREASREFPVREDLLTLLEHVVASAHAKEPGLIPEAVLVTHADRLDLEVAQMARLLERDASAGPFTDRDAGLGRALLKGREV
ncbi:MAG: HD domain-containing protein [Gemmataceae bacterium]